MPPSSPPTSIDNKDWTGRIIAIRVAGAIVKDGVSEPPPVPDYVDGISGSITYDVVSLDGLVNQVSVTPTSRCVEPDMDIRSARLMDRCHISFVRGEVRVYVFETQLSAPCGPQGPI